MAATFLYADFLKIIEDKVIHNPITIVAMAEERGLLQIRLEEVLKQEGDKDHVDKAKEKWSPAMQAHFPKTEQKTITIDDIRRRAQNAVRRRKGNLLKDIPSDGLASNGLPGLSGHRWKLLIPRDCWEDEEWQEFQAFLSSLEYPVTETNPSVNEDLVPGEDIQEHPKNDQPISRREENESLEEMSRTHPSATRSILSTLACRGLWIVLATGIALSLLFVPQENPTELDPDSKADDLYSQALNAYKSKAKPERLVQIPFSKKELILRDTPALYEGLAEPRLLALADTHPAFSFPQNFGVSPP